MVRSLPEFSSVYARRPIHENGGGMRYDHSFALWFMLRNVRPIPTSVIESGFHRGHSTWIIRSALPKAKIISVSPANPQYKKLPMTDKNIEYMTGKSFSDFAKVKWNEKEIDIENTVVLFDDHQSADIRILQQGKRFGFKKFVYDDNYAYLEGDNLSMKWLCEIDRKQEWLGYVMRNFITQTENRTWPEHMEQAQQLKHEVKYYFEFPPIHIIRKYSAAPLVTEKEN